MKLKVRPLLFLLLLLICAFTGCAKPEEEPVADLRWPVTVGEVSIPAAPHRVVTLSPAATETVIQLGYGGRLAGISDYCEPPEALGEVKRCGTALMPDTGAILSLSPDLVIASTTLPRETTTALTEAGAVVLVVRRADSLDGIIGNYRAIATAMQGAEQGAMVAEQLRYFADATLTYLDEAVSAALTEGASAVYLRRMPFIMATGDTLEGQWLSDLGFVNQAEAFTGWDYPLSAEPDLNPHYIFCDESVSLADLQSSDYYRRTSAVTNLRVYPLDGLLLERQTPQMFLEWESVMKEAFPEAFSEREKPSVVLPMEPPPPPPPPEEKSWWEKLFDRS